MRQDIKVVIKEIEEKHMPFLRDMLYQAIYVREGEAPPPRDVIDKPCLSKYIHGFGRPTDVGYVAVDSGSGRCVGAVWLRLFSADNCGWGYIDDTIPELSIAVDRAYRGRGIGTYLMEHLLQETAEQYPSISLSVQQENPAKGLYERLGFYVYRRTENDFVMRYDAAGDRDSRSQKQITSV